MPPQIKRMDVEAAKLDLNQHTLAQKQAKLLVSRYRTKRKAGFGQPFSPNLEDIADLVSATAVTMTTVTATVVTMTTAVTMTAVTTTAAVRADASAVETATESGTAAVPTMSTASIPTM